ncbi:MAG: nucleotidyltransferase domain-containing protein [Candidatus Jordarchaeaceae archaeon]
MVALIDEYTVKILKKLREGKTRFGELRQIVHNPRTLSKRLKMLVSRGLVKSENRLYSLSEKGERAESILENFEALLHPSISLKNLERLPCLYADFLSRYCEVLYEHFSQRLVGVLVFGSLARGSWDRDSDIDLLVVVEGWDKPVWERTRELVKLRRRMRETLEFQRLVERGFPTAIQHYPLSKSEALEPHRIYIDACMEGIILYEREGFLSKVLGEFREKLSKLGAKRITTADGKSYWQLKEVKAGEVFEL